MKCLKIKANMAEYTNSLFKVAKRASLTEFSFWWNRIYFPDFHIPFSKGLLRSPILQCRQIQHHNISVCKTKPKFCTQNFFSFHHQTDLINTSHEIKAHLMMPKRHHNNWLIPITIFKMSNSYDRFPDREFDCRV